MQSANLHLSYKVKNTAKIVQPGLHVCNTKLNIFITKQRKEQDLKLVEDQPSKLYHIYRSRS